MKNIKKIGCIILIIGIVCCLGYGSIALYVMNTDPFLIEMHHSDKKQSDYSFRVSESDLYITASKRENAQFYVLFSKDSLASLSDSIDYIKVETANMSTVEMIFNINCIDDIYIRESYYLKNVNLVKYNLHILESHEFDSLFFEPQIKTNPLILKYPYVHIGILTSGFAIYMDKYQIVQEKIKKGDIHGGW